MPRLFLEWRHPGQTLGSMREILRKLDPEGDRYEWLATDVSGAAFSRSDTTEAALSWALEREFAAPSFELLREFEAHDVRYQFAVFSAFRLAEAPDPNRLGVYPTVENNPALWVPDVVPQHPKALFEIVHCDGVYTLAVCRDDRWIERFVRLFPEAVAEDPLDTEAD